MHARPAVPFRIKYPGGEPVEVPPSNFIPLSRTGRMVTVALPDDGWIKIDVTLITLLEELLPSTSAQGRASRTVFHFATRASTLGWMKLRNDFGHMPPMSSTARRRMTLQRIPHEGVAVVHPLPHVSPVNIWR